MKSIVLFFKLLIINASLLLPYVGKGEKSAPLHLVWCEVSEGVFEATFVEMTSLMVSANNAFYHVLGADMRPVLIGDKYMSLEEKVDLVIAANRRMMFANPSDPKFLWTHPTTCRAPEPVGYLGTMSSIAKVIGVHPYELGDKMLKVLGPVSTPSGVKIESCNKQELNTLVVEDADTKYGKRALAIHDGAFFLPDAKFEITSYLSERQQLEGKIPSVTVWDNLSFQGRRRDGVEIEKGLKVFDTGAMRRAARKFGLTSLEGIDCITTVGNIKSGNAQPGTIRKVPVSTLSFDMLTPKFGDNSSGGFGAQGIILDQNAAGLIHREHSNTDVVAWDGSVKNLPKWKVFGLACTGNMAAWLHIAADKDKLSYEDFNMMILKLVAFGIPKAGRLEVPMLRSWTNQFSARLLVYLRKDVMSCKCSDICLYFMDDSELDDLRKRVFVETKKWVVPMVLPAAHKAKFLASKYNNWIKHPLTSKYSVWTSCFVSKNRDEHGKLKLWDATTESTKDILWTKSPNTAFGPAPIASGIDVDGDTIGFIPSNEAEFGNMPIMNPIAVEKGEKAAKPTTPQEVWEIMFDLLTAIKDSAKWTGMVDLKVREQRAAGLLMDRNWDDSAQFNIHEFREQFIKLSKKSKTADQVDLSINPVKEFQDRFGISEYKRGQEPHIYQATHPWGNVSRNFRSKGSNFILNAILGHMKKANEKETGFKFFLRYVFKGIQGIFPAMFFKENPSHTNTLHESYSKLWNENIEVLCNGTIFDRKDIEAFAKVISVKYRDKSREILRGEFSDRADLFNKLGDGIMAITKYLIRFSGEPVMEIAYRWIDDRTGYITQYGYILNIPKDERTEEERVLLDTYIKPQIVKWNDILNFIGDKSILQHVPDFGSVPGADREGQILSFLKAAHISCCIAGFGGTKSGLAALYFPAETILSATRDRYNMLGIDCKFLDNVNEWIDAHDSFIKSGGKSSISEVEIDEDEDL